MKHKDFDGITRKYTELTPAFCQSKPNLDIAAYFFAEGGAMGMNGDVKIFTVDHKWYHGNFCYGSISVRDAVSLLPGLDKFEPGLDGDVENVPQGYHYEYLGMGNHLFVQEKYAKPFKCIFDRISQDDHFFIYQTVLDAILANAR